MRRIAQSAAVAVVVGLLGLLVWDLAHQSGGISRDVDNGKVVAAPLFTRARVDTSGTLSLASLRGKVVVINFWQSYCAPCTHEARTLAQASKDWERKGVVFVGIDVQDFRSQALKFMARFGITYPNVRDNGSLVGHYGVTGYPETFFVDRKGRIVPDRHIVGPATRADLDQGIRLALRGSTAAA
jgi:cytochrome c biogenesis protein CcmG/thiol:disulfide interchange protein DsbE